LQVKSIVSRTSDWHGKLANLPSLNTRF
jgi:hypothetical protein